MTRRLTGPELRPWTMLALALVPTMFLIVGAGQSWSIYQGRISEGEAELGAVDDASLIHDATALVMRFETAASASANGFAQPLDFEDSVTDSIGAQIDDLLALTEQRSASAYTTLTPIAVERMGEALTKFGAAVSGHELGEPIPFELSNALAQEMFLFEQLWNQLEFGFDDAHLADRIEDARFLHNYAVAFSDERLTLMETSSLETGSIGESSSLGMTRSAVSDAAAVRSAAFASLASRRYNPFGEDPQFGGADPGAVLQSEAFAMLDGDSGQREAWFANTGQVLRDGEAAITAVTQQLRVDRQVELASARRDRVLVSGAGAVVFIIAAALWLVARQEVLDRRRFERAHSEAIDDLVVRAERDALTGLWNRLRPEKALPAMIAAGTPVVLGYVDLDEFKPLNDIWGHERGDQVLKLVADRLIAMIPEGFEVARFGGDEFVFFGPLEGADVVATVDLGRRIVQAVSAPMTMDGRESIVEATVGLSFTADITTTPSELMLEADAALIIAKNGQRGSALVYDREFRRDTELLRALPTALEAGEIGAHFQPAYDMATGRCVGVEALARWTRADGSMISPGEFIPLAESFGLMSQLTENILKCVGDLQADPDFPADCRTWLNVSAVELDSHEFCRHFLALARKHSVDVDRLGVEITETVAIRHPKNLLLALQGLRSAGAQIAIDDFGNGYSPLGFLRELPFDVLKLDRSIVSHVDSQRDLQVLVQGVVSMMAELDVEVVAEGIERREEFDWLASIGAHVAQGFLLARPLPKRELLEMIGNRALISVEAMATNRFPA